MTTYKPTIGLEIHAQLNTETKMFCNSANDPDENRPNVNVCPICMGHPGTLPTINKEAVRQVLRVGKALDGELADYSEFDRKNYFYPDIPKGYQISQYEHPLVSGGSLSGVEITRVHLEEDTGTNQHVEDKSLVNFNRAGTPLMELVTEPVISSGAEAKKFAKELQLLLKAIGASNANLEKGEMRVEANISIAPEDADEFGTKVEVKNLNSFAAAEQAIAFEIERQKELLENGEAVTQSTRGWDENAQETFAQRTKETADDYRYFPDPDLPKLKLSEIDEFGDEQISDSLPELPEEARSRISDFGVDDEDIETLLTRVDLKKLFDKTSEKLSSDEQKKLAVNYITSDVIGLERDSEESQEINPDNFASLIKMIDQEELGSRGGKDTLEIMFRDGGNPKNIAEENGLLQQSNEEELVPIVENIIDENPEVVEDFQNGKDSAIQYLIGQGMQKTQGSANPNVLRELFLEKLS